MGTSERPIIRIRNAMRRDLHFIEGVATAKEAADLMRKAQVEALIVNKRHPEDAYGVVPMIDLLHGVVAANRPPDQVNVYEIMTKPVITVPADMDIRYVVRLLLPVELCRAPLEDKSEYVGMITLTDLLMEGTLC